jgi:hypothetical protein
VTDSNNVTSTEEKPNFVLARLYDISLDNVDYPKVHYGSKTILFRKDLEVPKDELRYKRLFYESCNTGNYYLTTFNHGIVFYTVNLSGAFGILDLCSQLHVRQKRRRNFAAHARPGSRIRLLRFQ